MTNKLTLVDWDDTLFPTTWVNSTEIKLKEPSNEAIELFSTLDILISSIIMDLKLHGDIKIVSNGSRKWIRSCLNLLPTVSFILANCNINIMSARDLFEDDYEYKEWKRIAFQICVSDYFDDGHEDQHIISIGDSKYEHEALLELEEFEVNKPQKVRHLKSIRFKKDPDLNMVARQLKYLQNKLEDFIKLEGTHSLKIYKEV